MQECTFNTTPQFNVLAQSSTKRKTKKLVASEERNFYKLKIFTLNLSNGNFMLKFEENLLFCQNAQFTINFEEFRLPVGNQKLY